MLRSSSQELIETLRQHIAELEDLEARAAATPDSCEILVDLQLDFADLCPVAADAGPEVCRFRDDAHRLFDGGLPSLPFEGYSGARRIYQCPGTTGMTWKFQPPSGKDS